VGGNIADTTEVSERKEDTVYVAVRTLTLEESLGKVSTTWTYLKE